MRLLRKVRVLQVLASTHIASSLCFGRVDLGNTDLKVAWECCGPAIGLLHVAKWPRLTVHTCLQMTRAFCLCTFSWSELFIVLGLVVTHALF